MQVAKCNVARSGNYPSSLRTCFGAVVQGLCVPARQRQVRMMGTDRTDHRSLLTNEQMPRPMKHQATLLLHILDNPHVGSADGLLFSRAIRCLWAGAIQSIKSGHTRVQTSVTSQTKVKQQLRVFSGIF